MRDGRDAKPQMVHLITSIAYASRATREVGAALEARLLIRLSHAPVWRTAGIASGARAGDFPRAYRPRKWQDVGWTSRGQYAAVLGWSASSRGLLGERQA